jgi:hypothetical protein
VIIAEMDCAWLNRGDSAAGLFGGNETGIRTRFAAHRGGASHLNKQRRFRRDRIIAEMACARLVRKKAVAPL